MITRNHVTAG